MFHDERGNESEVMHFHRNIPPFGIESPFFTME